MSPVLFSFLPFLFPQFFVELVTEQRLLKTCRPSPHKQKTVSKSSKYPYEEKAQSLTKPSFSPQWWKFPEPTSWMDVITRAQDGYFDGSRTNAYGEWWEGPMLEAYDREGW